MVDISLREKKPLVSVVCIARNHEEYIEQALESLVSQRTTFRYQILVSDDNSSDNTAKIIREYARKYPDLVIPLIRKRSMGAQRNLISLCKKANTPYIAFCKGDDYWIDRFKLQKQFNYMESNPNLRACFHNALIEIDTEDEEENELFQHFKQNDEMPNQMIWPENEKGFVVKNTYTIEPYISNGFVHFSSMFIKWDEDVVIPDWFYKHNLSAYVLWILQVGKGSFGYLRDVMSAYRCYDKGLYYYKDNIKYVNKTGPDWIMVEEYLREYFVEYHNGYCQNTFAQRRNRETYNYLHALLKNNEYDAFDQAMFDYVPWSFGVLKWTFTRQNQYQTLLSQLPNIDYWNRSKKKQNEFKKLAQQSISKHKEREEKKKKKKKKLRFAFEVSFD